MLLLISVHLAEVVELNLVFVEQTKLEMQFTVFVAKQRESILRYLTAMCNSCRNRLAEKVNIYDIERHLILAVDIGKFREKIFPFFVLDFCTCFFDFGFTSELILPFGNNKKSTRKSRSNNFNYIAHPKVNEKAKILCQSKRSSSITNSTLDTLHILYKIFRALTFGFYLC